MIVRSRRCLVLAGIVVAAAVAAGFLLDGGEPLVDAPRGTPAAMPDAPAGQRAAAAERTAERTMDAPRRVTIEGEGDGATKAPPPSSRGKLVVHVTWRASSEPVAHARIVVLADRAAGAWSLGESEEADDQGRATFELDAGHYRVATARGGDAGAFRVQSGRTTDARIALRRGYAVAGRVLDERQRPIPDASLWLSERWSDRRGSVVGRTDAEGRFRVDGIVDHRLVSATARRHAPSHQHEVHAADGETRELTLELRDGGAELAGRIVDPAGRAIPGAIALLGDERVAYEARDETGRGVAGPLPRLLRADADGQFVASGLRAGPTRVRVKASGFAPVVVELVAVPGGGAEQLVQLQPEAIVFGVVHDRSDQPVADAEVSSGAADAFASSVARSDADGHYELRGLPAQLVELAARKQEVGRARESVSLRAGVRTPWNPVLDAVDLAGGTPLTGVVVDANGKPQAKLQVSIRDAAETATPGPQLRTGADGTFATRVSWDSVRIVVQAADGWRQFPLLVVDDVKPAAGPVRLEVPDPSSAYGGIEGNVLGPDGATQRARVTIWHQQARLWREFETTADGALHVEGVLPGALDLEVRAEGHPWLALGTREVVAGQVLQLGTIHLSPSGRIRGTFAVPVGVDPDALQFSIYRDRGPEGAVIRSLPGRFESGPLAPDEYEVRIQGRGVRTFNRRVAVRVGAASAVHADLQVAVVRTVVLVMPDGVRRPRSISLQVRDGGGDLVWSGGVGPGGDLAVEVSVVPGDFVLHATAEGGYAARVPMHVAPAPRSDPIRVELREAK